MAYHTEWIIEGRVILTVLSENVSLEDLQTNDGHIAQMMASGEKPVHLVIDVQHLQKFPLNIGQIRSSANRFLTHENMGWVVVVGMDNQVLNMLSTVISHVSSIQMLNAKTLDEALSRLKRTDTSLVSKA